jgi:hypothetical protein
MRLDETSFPPVGYFFALVTVLSDLDFPTRGEYMDMIHRYFCTSTFHPLRFQKELYSDPIERSMTGSVISSTFWL